MSDIEFSGENGNLIPIKNLGMYSDSTTMAKTEEFEQIVADADTVMLRPKSLSSFLAGLSIVDGVHASGGKISRLILPYIPGARQDRVNPTGDVGFMLNTVARIINSYDFETVLVADPHSPRAGMLINNMVEFPLGKIYDHLWRGYYEVIAPDKGARDRAAIAAGVISREQFRETGTGKGYIFAEKTRDVASGRLSNFDVKVEEGNHYIVVDDICDGGGTFLGLGLKIQEQGAFADLFVTHGIFSKGTRELKLLYKNIYTTNTRDIHERNDVMTFDILTEMRNYR
jgi:ribose-phosphate pyrophosphokinase